MFSTGDMSLVASARRAAFAPPHDGPRTDCGRRRAPRGVRPTPRSLQDGLWPPPRPARRSPHPMISPGPIVAAAAPVTAMCAGTAVSSPPAGPPPPACCCRGCRRAPQRVEDLPDLAHPHDLPLHRARSRSSISRPHVRHRDEAPRGSGAAGHSVTAVLSTGEARQAVHTIRTAARDGTLPLIPYRDGVRTARRRASHRKDRSTSAAGLPERSRRCGASG